MEVNGMTGWLATAYTKLGTAQPQLVFMYVVVDPQSHMKPYLL